MQHCEATSEQISKWGFRELMRREGLFDDQPFLKDFHDALRHSPPLRADFTSDPGTEAPPAVVLRVIAQHASFQLNMSYLKFPVSEAYRKSNMGSTTLRYSMHMEAMQMVANKPQNGSKRAAT